MSAEAKVFSNQMLLTMILDNLSSQELLQHRLVCKLWRDEANHLIRLRHQKFFFSPSTKTSSSFSSEGNSNNNLKQNWASVIQISFIYSPTRGTFIRASRRLLDVAHPGTLLEGSSLNPKEQQIESDFYQEVENYYNGQSPKWKSPRSKCKKSVNSSKPDFHFHCKMAGRTLDEFTDFLEDFSMCQSQDGDLDQSIFSHLSFRFECGPLWDHPEISWFLSAMGQKIRYLTGSFGDMKRPTEIDGSNKWDKEYSVLRRVPNLQVLTIMPRSTWYHKITKSIEPQINLHEAQIEAQVGGAQGETEGNMFGQLKCLRIQGRGSQESGHFVQWVLLKAQNVQKIVFENWVSPNIFPALGGVNFDSNLNTGNILPRPIRVITPITALWISIFEDSPQLLQCMAQLINVQQLSQGQKVKTLHLFLTPSAQALQPYNSPFVPPLLEILQAVAKNLETLSLVGGAGVFLEGLIQLQLQHNLEKPRLHSFPNVRKLLICLKSTRGLNRDDFYLRHVPRENLMDLDLTSKTSLSKVFPQVDELILNNSFHHSRHNQGCNLWNCFLPRPDLAPDLDLANPAGQNQNQVLQAEVNSVKKLYIDDFFSAKAFVAWKFSNLETLSLDYQQFPNLAPVMWHLLSLQTLVMHKVPVVGSKVGFWSPQLETLITGLSKELIAEFNGDLERDLPMTPYCDIPQYLKEKRAALRSRVNSPTILNLSRLRQVKLFFCMAHRADERIQTKSVFSRMFGLLVLDLLPPLCHLTIWAMLYGATKSQLLPQEVLENAVGSAVSTSPRVSLKTHRNDENVFSYKHLLARLL